MGVILWGILGWCCVVTAGVLIHCLAISRGRERMRLLWPALLLLAVLGLRFVGGWVLSRFDLGWRCIPRGMMDLGWSVLLIFLTCRTAKRYFDQPEERMERSGTVLLCTAVIVTAAACGILLFSVLGAPWRDYYEGELEGQRVVVESDATDYSSCKIVYRYVNPLVRGEQLGFLMGGELRPE